MTWQGYYQPYPSLSYYPTPGMQQTPVGWIDDYSGDDSDDSSHHVVSSPLSPRQESTPRSEDDWDAISEAYSYDLADEESPALNSDFEGSDGYDSS